MIALTIALGILQPSDPPAFENEELGIVLRRLPAGIKLPPPGEGSKALFDIVGEEKKIQGVAHHIAGWPRGRGRADSWEALVKKDANTKSLLRTREEVLTPPLGEAVRREWVWEKKDGRAGMLGLFFSRGDRTLILIAFAPEESWEQARATLIELTEQVEMHHVWMCQACGGKAMGGTATCRACKRSFFPRDDRIREFSRKFEIQIVLDPSRFMPVGDVAGDEPARRDAEAFCPMLAREVKKYPDEFFRRTDFGRIILCQNIRFGRPMAGKVLAFAMYHPEFVMVIDVTEKQKFATIHHEFFHFVDFLPDYETKDAQWTALNAKGFRYDPALWAEALLDSKVKGFISEYSRASEAEDKAELFACLMMDQKRARVRSRDDEILARKLARLKEIVRDFCPKMDGEHWKSIDR